MTQENTPAHASGIKAWLIDRFRPVRELAIEAVFGRRGLTRQVNGIPLRILPRYRWYFTPDYDCPVANYFRQRVHAGAVSLSIGANLGVYPLQFAQWSAPTGKVFAFEPNPQTASALRRHIALNNLSDRVRVVERAVAEAPGEANFYALGVDGMSRLGAPNPLLGERATALTVSVESLDQFCAAEKIRPDAMMVDVEGFEGSVLRGAHHLFTTNPPSATVVEMHPSAWPVAGTDRVMMERLLADYRLRVVPLSGQTDPLGEYGHVALEPEPR